jgi:alkylation response protein AidB-like acyl-CoA dehydrogenase
MNVELDDAAYELRDSVAGLLRRHAGLAPLRRYWAEDVDAEVSAGLMRDVGGLGLAGADGPPLDALCLVFEEFGRQGTAEPLLETFGVVGPFLARHGSGVAEAEAALAQLTIGSCFGTVQRGWAGAAPWGAECAYALVVEADEVVLCAGGTADRLDGGIDPARRPARIGAGAQIARFGPQAAVDATALVHVAYSNAMYGAGQAVLGQAVDYALVRRQFGREIGSFQAVKHLLAEAWAGLENCRRYLWYAAWAVDGARPEAARAARTAKALAGDAATRAGYAALQVHGGIGYTWECDLHLWLKRIQVLDGAFGSSDRHWQALGAALRDERAGATR